MRWPKFTCASLACSMSSWSVGVYRWSWCCCYCCCSSRSSCADLQLLGDCSSAESGVYYAPSAPVQQQQTACYQENYHQQDYVFNYYEQESSRGYTPSSDYAFNTNGGTASTNNDGGGMAMHRLPFVATDEFRFVAGDTEYFDVHLDNHPAATTVDELPLIHQQSDLPPSYDNTSLYVDPLPTFAERSTAASVICESTTSFDNQVTPITSESSYHPEPMVPTCLGASGGVCSNSCTVCGRFCARSSTLKTHLRVHSGERPYACRQCLKRFSQAANLTAHMRIHSGEKPFLCPVCHRKFSQSSSVTTHMRTHSGERPYACSLCKKSFSDSSTLTKHFRTHSGERPYQCRVCFMRFSQSGNLNRHMKIHGQKSSTWKPSILRLGQCMYLITECELI